MEGPVASLIFPLHNFRIEKDDDLRRLFCFGKSFHTSLLLVRFLESPDGRCRFLFAVKKKCGKACFRNRVRRILRDGLRRNLPAFQSSAWMHFNFIGSEGSFDRSQLRNDLREILDKTKLLPREFYGEKACR